MAAAASSCGQTAATQKQDGLPPPYQDPQVAPWNVHRAQGTTQVGLADPVITVEVAHPACAASLRSDGLCRRTDPTRGVSSTRAPSQESSSVASLSGWTRTWPQVSTTLPAAALQGAAPELGQGWGVQIPCLRLKAAAEMMQGGQWWEQEVGGSPLPSPHVITFGKVVTSTVFIPNQRVVP